MQNLIDLLMSLGFVGAAIAALIFVNRPKGVDQTKADAQIDESKTEQIDNAQIAHSVEKDKIDESDKEVKSSNIDELAKLINDSFD